MKTFIKVISVIVMAVSSIYLSVSLFLNHLIIQDVIPTVVDSSVVTNVLTDVSDSALSSFGINEGQTKQFVAAMKNDEETQDALENYAQTLINDVIYQENTFDETQILNQIENKKEIAYELLQPKMTKEQFDKEYQEAMNQIDLQQMHDTMVNAVSRTMDESSTIKDVVVKIYDFHNKFHIYLALVLLLISTGYLVYNSLKERTQISNSVMVTYLLCGILTLILAVGIVFVLSALASSSMHIKISSIRYMYLCGGIYITLGIVGYIVNVVLRRRT